MYIVLSTGSVCRTTDNAVIPADASNGDYAEYLAWLEQGNSPAPVAGEGKTDRVGAINERLAEIDLSSLRLLRSIVAGTAQQEDRHLLAGLDSEATDLRSELEGVMPAASERY